MAGRQPEQPRGPYVCEFCAEVWPSARALAGHIKSHGKAPAQDVPFPPVPPGFGPGPGMMPVLPPSFFLPPPVMALGQPVAPPRFFFGGMPRVQVRQPPAPPLRDPVVYDAGGTISMGMDPPVEIDFMGLRPRPEPPSPSFASWLNA
ncbi:unnamed protein product [Miscanthus lutarioriparius]|uniref:C2H2-type domain-containing protein n=1 Tax=Miscanthus lutarioriparius TaxID=422564 RepID=A0A811PXU5_9POAL|nr:unnamed protein product [Miscanthus lutarioriparius]